MSFRYVRADFLILAAGIVFLASLQRPVAALQAPKIQAWEYKSIIELSQSDIAVSETGLLNQAGSIGWELVAVIEGPAPKAKQFILKRAKPAS